MAELKDLIGKTLTAVQNTGEEIIFTVNENEQYKLYHSQDCCESVTVDDVVGDLDNLVGSPIINAEEVSSENTPGKKWGTPPHEYEDESFTWTFYKFATAKGYVDIKFYGTSNGYYSESVDFVKIGERDW